MLKHARCYSCKLQTVEISGGEFFTMAAQRFFASMKGHPDCVEMWGQNWRLQLSQLKKLQELWTWFPKPNGKISSFRLWREMPAAESWSVRGKRAPTIRSITAFQCRTVRAFHSFICSVQVVFLSMPQEEKHGCHRKRARNAPKRKPWPPTQTVACGLQACCPTTWFKCWYCWFCGWQFAATWSQTRLCKQKTMRNDLQTHGVNWSAQTSVALILPENCTWHVATPHNILQHFVSSVPNISLTTVCRTNRCTTTSVRQVTFWRLIPSSRRCCC